MQAVVTEDEQPELAETATDITYNVNGEFDWSNIPVSNVDIGDFPYISLPDGMVHKSSLTSSEPASADQPYTKPMVANDTEENKAKNRRVELVKID